VNGTGFPNEGTGIDTAPNLTELPLGFVSLTISTESELNSHGYPTRYRAVISFFHR
jgi:hypothetical protein